MKLRISFVVLFFVITACQPTPAVVTERVVNATSVSMTMTRASNTQTPAIVETATPSHTNIVNNTNIPNFTSAPTLSSDAIHTTTQNNIEKVYIPEGEFTLGTNSGVFDEQPAHSVFLDAYWIDRVEVTNAMFLLFVETTGYQTSAEYDGYGYVYSTSSQDWMKTQGANWQHPHGGSSSFAGLENHPVVQVTWEDAMAYCQWVGGSLPTEAQWTKAAADNDGRQYPWGNQQVSGERLNMADASLQHPWSDATIYDGYSYTAPVGSYPQGASPYGVLDMAGNVWEWTVDWYGETYYSTSNAQNPVGPSTGRFRVIRGGAWYNKAKTFLVQNRSKIDPGNRNDNIGFRCVQ